FVGTPMLPGEKVPVDDQFRILNENYRKLHVGARIEDGQVLAQLDPALAEANIQVCRSKVDEARFDRVVIEKTRNEAQKRYKTQKGLGSKNRQSTSIEDLRQAKSAWDRYERELSARREAVMTAERSLKLAESVLTVHTIHSPVRGVLK